VFLQACGKQTILSDDYWMEMMVILMLDTKMKLTAMAACAG